MEKHFRKEKARIDFRQTVSAVLAVGLHALNKPKMRAKSHPVPF